MHVSASILACDILNIEKELEGIDSADSIHFDVMDGEYVSQISFGSNLCARMTEFSKLPIYVHLMVNNPEKKIYEFVDAGASGIIVHPSACKNSSLEDVKELVTNRRVSLGFAIDSEDDFSMAIHNKLLADFFVFMTVKIGYSFQEIDINRVNLLKRFSSLINSNKGIFVDGGINPDNAGLCIKNGATGIISGGFIFRTNPHSLAIKKLRMSCDA